MLWNMEMLSTLNLTAVNISVALVPGSSFDASSNITSYTLISFKSNLLLLQLNFSNASLVSNNKPRDTLQITINNATDFQSTKLMSTN